MELFDRRFSESALERESALISESRTISESLPGRAASRAESDAGRLSAGSEMAPARLSTGRGMPPGRLSVLRLNMESPETGTLGGRVSLESTSGAIAESGFALMPLRSGSGRCGSWLKRTIPVIAIASDDSTMADICFLICNFFLFLHERQIYYIF